jgi:hypothetical protein
MGEGKRMSNKVVERRKGRRWEASMVCGMR